MLKASEKTNYESISARLCVFSSHWCSVVKEERLSGFETHPGWIWGAQFFCLSCVWTKNENVALGELVMTSLTPLPTEVLTADDFDDLMTLWRKSMHILNTCKKTTDHLVSYPLCLSWRYVISLGKVIMTCLPPIPTEGLTADDVDDLIKKVRDVMLKTFEETTWEMRKEAEHQGLSILPPLQEKDNPFNKGEFELCGIQGHLVSVRTFGVMCDRTLFCACSNIRPHVKWTVSLVTADGH